MHRELAQLTHKQKKEAESEKTMYKRMMGTMADAAQKRKGERSGYSVSVLFEMHQTLSLA